ncbi:MAG: hypothetical protein ACXVHB_14930 [Solirubrobacteraceae bacterium]
MSDEQLVDLIDELTTQDQETAYLRDVAERKVVVLRAELTRRSSSADDDVG